MILNIKFHMHSGFFFKRVFIALLLISFAGTLYARQPQHFNGSGISRQALNRYLSRAVTIAEFLTTDPYGIDGPYPYKEDDIRLIRNTGARFIGRAIYRWGRESALNKPDFWNNARQLLEEVHRFDPDIIFQGALFEIVTPQVNTIHIPDRAFTALGLPAEDRNFRYQDMLNKDGRLVDHWKKDNSVPDITRPETQLWFMYLAGAYMDLGCEALHLGQVSLMGMADKGFHAWAAFLEKLRAYAREHARRKWILLDAHTPDGGMVVNGKSLLDFNSFPLRIKEVPEEPEQAVLQQGYLDALFNRSLGGITPSGWTCTALPYLVELDNFGISKHPGVADTTDHYVWGYDEITWFYLQPEAYRNKWLQYAYDWLAMHDANGRLQMPVSRIVIPGKGRPAARFRGNTRSAACPEGMNTEETIKKIWFRQPR